MLAGLLHWGITHVVFALSYFEDAISSGSAAEAAVSKADELLGKAGSRCNEALQYMPGLLRAAMIIAVIHHLRAVMHSGLTNLRSASFPSTVQNSVTFVCFKEFESVTAITA